MTKASTLSAIAKLTALQVLDLTDCGQVGYCLPSRAVGRRKIAVPQANFCEPESKPLLGVIAQEMFSQVCDATDRFAVESIGTRQFIW